MKDDMTPSLAEMCKFARLHMGMSQTQFSKYIGSNQTEVSFIERGFIPEDGRKRKRIENFYYAAVQNSSVS